MVKQPKHAARFRLQALTDEFMQPLRNFLGANRFFFGGDEMTSLDCLALGYLSLALKPDLPQSWLAEAMSTKYTSLVTYVNSGVERCFGGPVTVFEALPSLKAGSVAQNLKSARLPWREPLPKSFWWRSSPLVSSALSSIPVFGPLTQENIILSSTRREDHDVANSSDKTFFLPVIPAIVAVSSTILALGSYLVYSGTISFSADESSLSEPEPNSQSRNNLLDFSALDTTSLQYDQDGGLAEMIRERDVALATDIGSNASRSKDSVPIAEVDITVDDVEDRRKV